MDRFLRLCALLFAGAASLLFAFPLVAIAQEAAAPNPASDPAAQAVAFLLGADPLKRRIGIAILVGLGVRWLINLLKDPDAEIPQAWVQRVPLITAALSVVAAIVDRYATGTSWQLAIITGGGPMLSVLAHEVITAIKSLRKKPAGLPLPKSAQGGFVAVPLLLGLAIAAALLAGCAGQRLDTYERALLGVDQALTAGASILVDSDRAYQHAVADPAAAQAKSLDASGNHAQAEQVKAAALVRIRTYEANRDKVVAPTIQAIRTGSAVAHATLAAGRALGEVPADLPGKLAQLAGLVTQLAAALPAMAPVAAPVLVPDASAATAPDGGTL
jgi:hypothetical protein